MILEITTLRNTLAPKNQRECTASVAVEIQKLVYQAEFLLFQILSMIFIVWKSKQYWLPYKSWNTKFNKC